MRPPNTINVIDQHGGFTAVTKFAKLPGPSWFAFRRMSTNWSMVGVGLGGLSKEEVLPIISMLPDNVTVCQK